ncbi:hypothetical protein [Paraburkholderia nemoris]|uniref:hypothetical protein n=1 Tax=Paraburkholderia nemoris TaxID=2793076 RepID=UPI001B8C6FC8|nr:hypothetical protein [Paraburkholderia nemoris]
MTAIPFVSAMACRLGPTKLLRQRVIRAAGVQVFLTVLCGFLRSRSLGAHREKRVVGGLKTFADRPYRGGVAKLRSCVANTMRRFGITDIKALRFV